MIPTYIYLHEPKIIAEDCTLVRLTDTAASGGELVTLEILIEEQCLHYCINLVSSHAVAPGYRLLCGFFNILEQSRPCLATWDDSLSTIEAAEVQSQRMARARRSLLWVLIWRPMDFVMSVTPAPPHPLH